MKKFIAIAFAALLLCAGLAGCGKTDDKTITVAASSAPHAQILEQCKAAMSEAGYTLVIKVMDDYVIPNTSTEDGEVDANYFQHVPYLEEFNASRGTHLTAVARVHYEPYAIYAGTVKSIEALTDGAKLRCRTTRPNEGARAAAAGGTGAD